MRATPPQQQPKEVIVPRSKAASLTRRQGLKVGAATTFADYRPSYHAEAAADAWKRCTGLFAKSLKA